MGIYSHTFIYYYYYYKNDNIPILIGIMLKDKSAGWYYWMILDYGRYISTGVLSDMCQHEILLFTQQNAKKLLEQVIITKFPMRLTASYSDIEFIVKL